MPEAGLGALPCGAVVFPVPQGIRHTFHMGELFFGIVGVLVALRVMQILHQLRGGVAQVEGHRLGEMLPGVLQALLAGEIDGVGAGSQGQIDHGVGQVDVPIRWQAWKAATATERAWLSASPTSSLANRIRRLAM